jgi:hypothetical protein
MPCSAAGHRMLRHPPCRLHGACAQRCPHHACPQAHRPPLSRQLHARWAPREPGGKAGPHLVVIQHCLDLAAVRAHFVLIQHHLLGHSARGGRQLVGVRGGRPSVGMRRRGGCGGQGCGGGDAEHARRGRAPARMGAIRRSGTAGAQRGALDAMLRSCWQYHCKAIARTLTRLRPAAANLRLELKAGPAQPPAGGGRYPLTFWRIVEGTC